MPEASTLKELWAQYEIYRCITLKLNTRFMFKSLLVYLNKFERLFRKKNINLHVWKKERLFLTQLFTIFYFESFKTISVMFLEHEASSTKFIDSYWHNIKRRLPSTNDWKVSLLQITNNPSFLQHYKWCEPVNLMTRCIKPND